MKKIIILICLIICTTGCFNYKELNDINILDSIAIDYIDDEYIVYLNIYNSNEKDIETTLIKSQNKDLNTALDEAYNKTPKLLFKEHLSLIILSENLCKYSLNDLVRYLISDTTLSSNYNIVIGNIENIYNIDSKNDTVATKINNLLNKTNKYNNQVLNNLIDNKDIALPLISIDDNNLYIDQIGYFNKDKLIDYTDIKLYNFLMQNNKNNLFTYNNNTLNIYKKNIKYDINKNKIIININAYASIITNNDNKNYQELEESFTFFLKNDIENFLNTTTDILGLKDMYYKKYNKNMNILNYEINIKVKINKNNNIKDGIYDK